MNATRPVQRREKPLPAQEEGRNWKRFFGRTIVLVLTVSLAVHVLLLLAFGSVAIFKGSIPKLPFVSQEIPKDVAAEVPAPPEDSTVQPNPEESPFAEEVPTQTSTEESAPALEMLTVVGGANWAPAIPKNAPTSETGVIGGSGKGLGSGIVGGKGSAAPLAEKVLFGIPVQAKKLGVIVDVSGSMQRYTPGLFKEIFEKFPDADVVLTNGGGIMDWETALKKFNEKVTDEKKKAKETGKDYRGPSKMERPRLARFNTGEAEDWVPVRGPKMNRENYRGLKEDYPELYEQMRKRGNTWFITSYTDANAVHLAFEELIQRKAEAIYWFSDFADPIEGKEAANVTRLIQENKVEVILHSTKGKGRASDWAGQVQAKFVKAKF